MLASLFIINRHLLRHVRCGTRIGRRLIADSPITGLDQRHKMTLGIPKRDGKS